jgi:hypothetical protein
MKGATRMTNGYIASRHILDKAEERTVNKIMSAITRQQSIGDKVPCVVGTLMNNEEFNTSSVARDLHICHFLNTVYGLRGCWFHRTVAFSLQQLSSLLSLLRLDMYSGSFQPKGILRSGKIKVGCMISMAGVLR